MVSELQHITNRALANGPEPAVERPAAALTLDKHDPHFVRKASFQQNDMDAWIDEDHARDIDLLSSRIYALDKNAECAKRAFVIHLEKGGKVVGRVPVVLYMQVNNDQLAATWCDNSLFIICRLCYCKIATSGGIARLFNITTRNSYISVLTRRGYVLYHGFKRPADKYKSTVHRKAAKTNRKKCDTWFGSIGHAKVGPKQHAAAVAAAVVRVESMIKKEEVIPFEDAAKIYPNLTKEASSSKCQYVYGHVGDGHYFCSLPPLMPTVPYCACHFLRCCMAGKKSSSTSFAAAKQQAVAAGIGISERANSTRVIADHPQPKVFVVATELAETDAELVD